jgi:hypothetical protein
VYYFRPLLKTTEYAAYRILLSSSFLTIIYCFLVYILPYDISILSNGAQVKDSHTPITNPPRHLRVRSGFQRFFSSLFWRVKKRLMPTCIRFHSSLPCHSWTWTTIFPLLLFRQSLFLPDEHSWAIVYSMPLISIFRSFSVSRCTLFGIYSPPSRH